jgi:hypothetical protein
MPMTLTSIFASMQRENSKWWTHEERMASASWRAMPSCAIEERAHEADVDVVPASSARPLSGGY